MPTGLPPGLRLNARTGDITGTIAIDETPATYEFTLYVRDSGGFLEAKGLPPGDPFLSIEVTPYTNVQFQTVRWNNVAFPHTLSSTNAVVLRVTRGKAFSWPFEVTNVGSASGPFSWDILGPVPTGLSMSLVGSGSLGTAVLSGTPTQTSGFTPIHDISALVPRNFSTTYMIDVRVTDNNSVSRLLRVALFYADELTVTGQPPSINQFGSLSWYPTVTGGFGTGNAVNGPQYHYSIIGSIPPGFTFLDGNGFFAGHLFTNNASVPGVYNFTIRVQDFWQNPAATLDTPSIVDHPVTVTVTAPLAVNGTLPSIGVETGAYSGSLSISGGTSPYTVVASGLPPGLSAAVSGSSVLVTGTPSVTGASGNVTYNVNFTVTDDNGIQASSQQTITIRKRLFLIDGYTANWATGIAYNSSPNLGGGLLPLTFALQSGSLPSGFSLNTATGAITGTASSQGTHNFTVRVTDSASITLDIVTTLVITAPMTITGTPPPATIGVAYSYAFTRTGGSGPFTFSLNPNGLFPPSGWFIVGDASNNHPVLQFGDGVEPVTTIPSPPGGPYICQVSDNTGQVATREFFIVSS